MLVKCPSCKRNIDIQALKCGYCQEIFSQEQKDKLIKERNQGIKSCFGCLTVFFIFFIVIAIIPSPKNQNINNKKKEITFKIGEKKLIKKENWIGAFSNEDYKKANMYISQNDSIALNKLFDSNKIFIVPKEKPVFIVGYHPFSGSVEIPYEGFEEIIWVSSKIFE